MSLPTLPRYPGRGLLTGVLNTGEPFVVYYLTGRSPASRGRRIEVHGDQVVVVPTSGVVGEDPLRYYTCFRQSSNFAVVGNGAHVEEIFKQRKAGLDFLTALSRYSYEPDGPIFTPRIVAEASYGKEPAIVAAGACRRVARDATAIDCLVLPSSPNGVAISLRTYDSDGRTIESNGRPELVTAISTLEELAVRTWQGLEVDFRVALFATTLPLTQQATIFH